MARISVGLKVKSSLLGQGTGANFRNVGHFADVTQTVSSTAVAADIAAVDAAVATLVADGATPTQAHVTTLNTAQGTLDTDWAALLAGLPGIPAAADVVLSYNATNVVSKNILLRAIDRLVEVVKGSGDLT
jgi:hypothetical protein